MSPLINLTKEEILQLPRKEQVTLIADAFHKALMDEAILAGPEGWEEAPTMLLEVRIPQRVNTLLVSFAKAAGINEMSLWTESLSLLHSIALRAEVLKRIRGRR